VIFVAPTVGPSGTFAGGSTTAFAETDAEGVAEAPTFYANDTTGGYAVEAESSGYTSPVGFAMTNEGLSSMTVSSVTPTVLSQGSHQRVMISGSDFQSGAGVTFSSPGVTVTSTTVVSAQELSAEVTVSTSARVGASNVTVADPAGSSSTGTGVFTVAPRVDVAPGPLELGFVQGVSRLSGAEERTIRQFARALPSATPIECVGYGDTANLARARSLRVARYLQSADPHARVLRRAIVTGTANKVTVEAR
jgi:hypothetical protein